VRPLAPPIKPNAATKLQNITFHGFAGGLNTLSSDLSLDARYLIACDNFRRTPSGSLRVRWGNQWFADVSGTVTGDIVDMIYFANAIVAITTTGEGVAMDDEGVKTAVWNTTIANALSGSPSAWSATDTVDFVPFKSKLIVHNGVDKPISFDQALAASYLADAGTGANTNTPIGKYGCVVANYHCVAGISAAPTSIYVSSKGTDGTFYGDPAPNDAIIIDVGAYAPEGAPEIRGIAGYRNTLIVFFATQAVPITLGVYDDTGNHTPTFPEALPPFGLIGHRCIVSVEKDLLFAGFDGVCSVERNILSGLTDADVLSDNIEPTYRREINALTPSQVLKNCFMIYDRLLHDTITYTPTGTAFVFSANTRAPNKYRSWSEYSGPEWVSACRSTLGRVFYSKGSRVYKQGNDVFANEKFYADRTLDRDANWIPGHAYDPGALAYDIITNESYKCIGGHVSGGSTFQQDRTDQMSSPKWELWEGDPISITLELPWLDGKDPMRNKMLRFISMATRGTAEYTVKAWVDNLYKDYDGNILHDPALQIPFMGNDALGFGHDEGPYGGGRRSNDPRLYRFPLQFKTLKLSITGEVSKPLEISTFSFLYAKGKYSR